jgi:thiamine-phosphate pyrophosphorylase
MKTAFKLPRLYAIVDIGMFQEADVLPRIINFVQQLREGGASLFQYRNKGHVPAAVISHGRELRRMLGGQTTLIINDRADLAVACGADGVHVGQDDLSVEGARRVLGENAIVGISTHNLEQVLTADQTTADYVAVGPVFSTSSKSNPDPVVGLELVEKARKATSKPLVAIGGIHRGNCRSVLAAGADAAAVISDLHGSPQKRVEEFLAILG